MNILLITDRRYPCDHAFLETVYSNIFPQRGHKIYWIMRSENIGKRILVRKWNQSIVIVIPTFNRKNYFYRSIQNLILLKMLLTILIKRDIDIAQVRNWVWAGFLTLFINKK